MSTDIVERHNFAISLVPQAAEHALSLFRDRDALNIEVKGLQDWVSNADKSVEDKIRAALTASYPDDSIIGEEHGNTTGNSGFTWVIDPIDGTTNFVNGSPGWCVVLACVYEQRVVCSVVCDPISDEIYSARLGNGATLNGAPLQVSQATALDQGTLGVGHNARVRPDYTVELLTVLVHSNGLYKRSGSGALDLAYVAAGRLIGYVEPHMNSWDCLASLLLIEEAGGKAVPFDMEQMLNHGGSVIVAGAGVFDTVQAMAKKAYELE